MASSLGIAPLLKPNESLDSKWLQRDPVDLIKEKCLLKWYDELVEDKEVYIRPESYVNQNGFISHQSFNGHYYCGQNVLDCQCCNGVCGPTFGCNCPSCQELEEEIKDNEGREKAIFSSIESWAWGNLPSQLELKSFAQRVAHTQFALLKESTESISFMTRIKARINVYARFLAISSKTSFSAQKKENSKADMGTTSSIESGITGLVGTEEDLIASGLDIFMKYTFKFLENAWQNEIGVELCSEMLTEAVDLFGNIKKVLLFEDSQQSTAFLDMTNKLMPFLEDLVGRESYIPIPISNRKKMLVLLFEMSFQNASLTDFLRVIVTCLKLERSGVLDLAPLTPFVKKLLNYSQQLDYDPEILKFYFSGSVNNQLSIENELSVLHDIDVSQEEQLSTIVSELMRVLTFFVKPYQLEENEKNKKRSDDLLVWGNLKLLASLREEKPSIKIATICCTENFVVLLSLTGAVYWCEHSNETLSLKPYCHVQSMYVIQIACSYGGHFIALSKEKEIFTWKDTNNSFEHLSVVQLHTIAEPATIYVGYSHYAVLTKDRELCIWENSLSGRPTHDNHHLQFFPRSYAEFEKDPVINVAFSQYHAEAIVVSEQGKIWSWLNDKVTLLSDESLDIVKVYIAKYFYVALSSTGQVWRWGRDRFSKVKCENMICMQSVEKLNKQNVLAISVGAYHCIALTDSYNVFCWGGLGGKEEDESLIREPALLKAVSDVGVTNITAGPHQIFCWASVLSKKVRRKAPFCIDVKEETFKILQTLLAMAGTCDDLEQKYSLIQPCLTLLKLQFQAAKQLEIPAEELGFDGKKAHTVALKDFMIDTLLDHAMPLEMKEIATDILECGWQYLLPTAAERAKSLSQFLKLKREPYDKIHSFLLNLLMNCLTRKNGLEVILQETVDSFLDSKKDNVFTVEACTLYVLLKDLLLINVSSCYAQLDTEDRSETNNLHKDTFQVLSTFQRLLFARIFIITEKDLCWPARCYVFEPTPTVKHLTSIINFYTSLLQTSCKQILNWEFKASFNADAMIFCPIGLLLQEFLSYMIILQNYAPVVGSNCDGLPQFTELLDAFKSFNKTIDISSTIGSNDLAFVSSKSRVADGFRNESKAAKFEGAKQQSEKAEEIVDVEDTLESFVDKEIENVFDEVFKTNEGIDAVKNGGNKGKKCAEHIKFERRKQNEAAVHASTDDCRDQFLHLIHDVQISISFLLGLHCCYLSHGMYPSQDEITYKPWLASKLFSAGIDRNTVLKDNQVPTDSSITQLLGFTMQDTARPEEQTSVIINYLFNHAKRKGIQVIPDIQQADIYLELTTKSIFAAMISHCGLEDELRVINKFVACPERGQLVDEMTSDHISESILKALKLTLKERTSIFQQHQETQRSYVELCQPKINRCKFMCHCLIASFQPVKQTHLNKWIGIITKLKLKYSYNWNITKWGIQPYNKIGVDLDERVVIMKEICKFVKDDTINTDIIKKCFLIQVEKTSNALQTLLVALEMCGYFDKLLEKNDFFKQVMRGNSLFDKLPEQIHFLIKRTKQRLISGYLMQSLSLRQHLLPSVKYSLLLGWLGLSVPGGSVSHPKPGILFNVQLVPKDDVAKLRDVFRGFEDFSLKIIFDELEHILIRMEDKSPAALEKHVLSSARVVLLHFTVLISSFMSGDVNHILQYSLLDKLQMLLKRYGSVTTKSFHQSMMTAPFIDEQKRKELQLQEMNGEDMAKLMKIGTRVVRGSDWKWDDQDGPPPHQGSVISDVADDGWVRVEWDSGSRNSYRMGKNGKYDLKVVKNHLNSIYNGDIEDLNDDDNDDDEKESDDVMTSFTNEKGLNERKEEPNLAETANNGYLAVTYLIKTITSMLLHALSYVGFQEEVLTPLSLDVIKNFIIDTLRHIVDSNAPNWGPFVNIPAAFGVIRAISTSSKQLARLLTDNDWINLLVKMLNLAVLKQSKDALGNTLYVKVQLVRHIGHMIQSKDCTVTDSSWKRWFVRSLMKMLNRVISNSSLFISDISLAMKTSMTASENSTLAEEIISLLRKLSKEDTWRDIVNMFVWKSLSSLSVGSDISTFLKIKMFSVACVIGGIDTRVRIGGYAHSSSNGYGTISKILPDGNILLYFGNNIKPKYCHLSKLDLIPEHTFDMTSPMFFHFGIELCFKMVYLIMDGSYKENILNDTSQMDMRLYIVALRCLSEASKNRDLMRSICRQVTCEEKNVFHHILQTSLHSSTLKSIYDDAELQMTAVCLCQALTLGMFQSDTENTSNLFDGNKTKNVNKTRNAHVKSVFSKDVEKDAENPSSSQLMQVLSAMGFPTGYIEVAVKELGETARPEQIVSWLLENPNAKAENNQNQRRTSNLRVDITKNCDEETILEQSQDEDVFHNMFYLGCVVRCKVATEDISSSNIGTVLKILASTKNVLVFWENLNKSLWIPIENLEVVKSLDNRTVKKKIAVGSRVQYVGAVGIEEEDGWQTSVGVIQQLKENGRKAIVLFGENVLWEGSISDLSLVDADCEYELLLINKHKNKNVFESSFSASSCVKEVLVSSNEHLAARMFNQEMDMPWISDESTQPHWIKVRLQPNTLITSVYVSLDTTQPSMYPSMFQVYGGISKKTKTLLNTVVLKKPDTTIVKLLDEVDKVYGVLEFKISVECEETPSKNLPCLISYLNISSKKQNEGCDQQVLNFIYCQEKTDTMQLKMEQMKIKDLTEEEDARKKVNVFCWGLNDKDQLGGMRGSKIKFPSLSENLSSLTCRDIVGGSKTLFCVTHDGKVYACGESTSNRLGLGALEGNITIPRLIDGLGHTVVKKVAVHSGGIHAMALTVSGEVYSWGDGEDGKLGHGNKLNCEKPRLVIALSGSMVTDIACGSAHSAAIVNNKDLYTWGMGDYGRLGHGDEITQSTPKRVKGLLGYNVVDVSLGSRDAQTVCLTDDGNVWSWGDGDFGKLGRGGSEGCLVPVVIEKLRGLGVCRILCGAQFTLALTNSGTVWTWGKGDFFRLGHNSDAHIREPKCIEFLLGKQIIDVAVGALHCLAVTEDGEVYAWGDNDHGQQGTGTTTSNRTPARIIGIEEHRIKRVSCGSSHSVAWAEINPSSTIFKTPVPFPANRDPLGANVVFEKDNVLLDANFAKFMKEQRPSLVRTSLQIISKNSKELVLKNILNTLQIEFSRTFLVEFLKHYLDDEHYFTNTSVLTNLTVDQMKNIIKLLKLGVYGHLSKSKTEILERFLAHSCAKRPQLGDVLVDVCVAELEDKLVYNRVIQDMYQQCAQESSHPYIGAPGVKLSGSVKYPGAVMLVIEFSPECQTEAIHDILTFYDGKNRILAMRTGSNPSDWNTRLRITGEEMYWTFITNSAGGLWGFRFTVTPIAPSDDIDTDCLSDVALLQQPCLELVKRLFLCGIVSGIRNEATILTLASLLSKCIRIPMMVSTERKWMLDYLHVLLISHNAPPIDVPAIMGCGRFRDLSVCKLRLGGNLILKDVVLSSSLARFINGVPPALLKQYEFEEPYVRRGDQLMFSPFLRSLVLFACSLGLDQLPCCSNKHQWAWFIKYCMAIRTAQSLIQNTKLPNNFALHVREKIEEVLNENEIMTFDHEDNNLFSKTEDEQLMIWLNTRAQDWSVIWGGSGTVYGWGHNHRGQLGGIEGAKVKNPTTCDSLAALKPVQMAGGEQTLFCVTFDGKIYATGYGNSSRLGLGIVETVSTPHMIESLQHINIKKIMVHSGGRHCLALSSDGEVFSWGEGDDGKLGHGNRNSCSHPKLIESFVGKNIVDIACGGSHSAAIGSLGELYTWGKGRYGRLGHGDGEDQLRPKLVEALQNYHVIDVACGSGDAQTLCVTSEHTVWAWGDGDYGKLGRGGSDGCKTPLIVDDLTGKSVIKVECGSQFSMALTRQGALYTWGKGDYFRLGHGSEDHVRRPRRVMALEHKLITTICCGSLHCVVCTDDGEVYSWGDNDEGQLGDGTTTAGQLPKLCSTLQNKKIDCIACGSAHTIAWSTCQNVGHTLPQNIPMEYNQLQDISILTLRNRAFLLHCFSKLFCSCGALMELSTDSHLSALTGDLMVNSLKRIILSSFKESTFRKVINITMVRDRQHGPVIELNRVKKHRVNQGLAGPDGSKSVFGQVTSKITEFSAESFCLPNRTWKVKFIGESVDDCGGGFSESIAEMCEELQNGALPLLITTPNCREENAESTDCFIINPDAKEETHKKLFRFLGILLGIAVRCGSPLSLSLSECVWKQLVGLPLTLEDIEDIDRGFAAKYSYLSSSITTMASRCGIEEKIDICSKEFVNIEELDLPFTVRSSSSKEVQLSANHKEVTIENKADYLKSALHHRLHEFDNQIHWIRSGMAQVIPVPFISLFTSAELENMICGNPEIEVEFLRSITSYRGIESTSLLVKWFWQTLDDFTNHERSLFLRFVWGRTRLPRTAVDFKGKDFIFQVLDKYHPADQYLPESYTCFFMLKMPRYSNANILKEKLKYAIYFCKSIDSDDYARIDLSSS